MLAMDSFLRLFRFVRTFDRNTHLEFVIYSHFVCGRGGLVGSSSSSSSRSCRKTGQ